MIVRVVPWRGGLIPCPAWVGPLLGLSLLGCAGGSNPETRVTDAADSADRSATTDTLADTRAVPPDGRDTGSPEDAEPVRGTNRPLGDAAASPDGTVATDLTGVTDDAATEADVDAYLNAWCDWDVRCSPGFPLSICEERKGKMKPEAYRAASLAAAARCLASLSCDGYAEDCTVQVAQVTIESEPSRAETFASCGARSDECTGENQLDLLHCYSVMVFVEAVQPTVRACLAESCSQIPACFAMIGRKSP
jgi:hypothetical protein